MCEWPTPLRILALRSEVSDLSGAARQLRLAGLDSASVELLCSRKRAELNDMMKRNEKK